MPDLATIGSWLGGGLFFVLLARYGGAWAGGTVRYLARGVDKQIEGDSAVAVENIRDAATTRKELWERIEHLELENRRLRDEADAKSQRHHDERDRWSRERSWILAHCPDALKKFTEGNWYPEGRGTGDLGG